MVLFQAAPETLLAARDFPFSFDSHTHRVEGFFQRLIFVVFGFEVWITIAAYNVFSLLLFVLPCTFTRSNIGELCTIMQGWFLKEVKISELEEKTSITTRNKYDLNHIY